VIEPKELEDLRAKLIRIALDSNSNARILLSAHNQMQVSAFGDIAEVKRTTETIKKRLAQAEKDGVTSEDKPPLHKASYDAIDKMIAEVDKAFEATLDAVLAVVVLEQNCDCRRCQTKRALGDLYRVVGSIFN
jgi:hypothetical protein